MSTHDSGEPVLQNTALEELLHRLSHNGTQRTMVSLELFLVDHTEPLEVLLEETVKRRTPGTPGTVDRGGCIPETLRRGHGTVSLIER